MADIGKRPYEQVARARAQQRTREALLDAAIEEFTQGHWGKASLTELATKASVTKQTLLRHFGSKDGLLMQALASSGAEMFKQRWSAPQGDIGFERSEVSATLTNAIEHLLAVQQ